MDVLFLYLGTNPSARERHVQHRALFNLRAIDHNLAIRIPHHAVASRLNLSGIEMLQVLVQCSEPGLVPFQIAR